MQKNVSGQKIAMFAFDYSTGAPKTGDAGNLTPYVDIDWGGLNALTDSSATEISSTNAPGWYLFDVTQAETNGDALLFTCKSGTANVAIVGQQIYTVPANFSLESIDSNGRVDIIKVAGTTQTARDLGASVLISSGTGTGQLSVASGIVGASLSSSERNALADATLARTLGTESYAADTVVPTLAQSLFMLIGLLGNFSFGGVTQTVKKLDKSTTAMTYTIDSATAPTSHTRAT